MPAEVLGLRIFGPFAHFRKFYSNVSALSYYLPPKTTILGLLAAIVGKNFSDFYATCEKLYDEMEIAISINSNLKKMFYSTNYLDTSEKNFKIQSSPTRIECILNPDYTIYARVRNGSKNGMDFITELSKKVKKHETHYTPYFGSANMIANFEFLGEFPIYTTKDCGEVYSAIPTSTLGSSITSGSSARILFDRFPLKLGQDRSPLGYIDLAFNIEGEPIPVSLKAKQEHFVECVNGKHVAFF